MDLNNMSRKELQALCKSNGIPANKTNAFMVEALAKKRVPLSNVDANRDKRIDKSILSPFKSPPPGKKDVNGIGLVQKPPAFKNDFLRKGKRKDPLTFQEEKPKMEMLKKQKVEVVTAGLTSQEKVQDKVVEVLKKAKVEGVVTGLTSKEKVDDKVRSQIDEARCHNLLEATERLPSAPTTIPVSQIATNGGNSERVIPSDVKVENSEVSKFTSVKSDANTVFALSTKVENREVPNFPNLPLECPTEQADMESSLVPDTSGCQLSVIEEEPALTLTTPEKKYGSLELVAASPPVRLSPLLKLEGKVQSIVQRIHNFWKASNLTVVNSFGSQVTSIQQ